MFLSTIIWSMAAILRDSVRRRRRSYAPTSNAASHDNHEKIRSWVAFSLLYEYGAPLGGPSGLRSSTITLTKRVTISFVFSKPFNRAKALFFVLVLHKQEKALKRLN